MGLSLEEMELETSELLPSREVMGCLTLTVSIQVKVGCEPPPCYQPCNSCAN